MQTTTLGRTGLEVSQLGAGLVQIGDLSLNETDQASRILGSALDAGINFLDTAECYNNSEELIGKTVSHRRNEFILATKVGHRMVTNYQELVDTSCDRLTSLIPVAWYREVFLGTSQYRPKQGLYNS